jgi:predicted N-acetyltransferase YhbS
VPYTYPEPLRGKHDRGDFCCGDEELDAWLHRYARHAEAAGSARTFVTTSGGKVVGYYALTVGQVGAEEATERLLKGQPRGRPVPVLILARLSVDTGHQGKGVGWSLLQDAFLRCMAASENVGARAIIAHPRGDADSFYDRFGFEASPANPRQRILWLEDARAFIEENEGP